MFAESLGGLISLDRLAVRRQVKRSPAAAGAILLTGELADAPPQARPGQAQDHLWRGVRDPPETLRIRREFQSSDETQGDDAQVNDQAGSRTAIRQPRRSTSKTAPQPPHRMQLGNMHQMKYAAEVPDRRLAAQAIRIPLATRP